MIGYLKGELAENRPEGIVVDVGGVGYNVIVSQSTRDELPSIGEPVKIYTYTCVREDAFLLYGFLRRDDLDTFLQLITVSGVGPKGGLCILSTLSPGELKYAILSQDAKLIAKSPTIGMKTAERIIIDLKDKISKDDILSGQVSSSIDLSGSNLTNACKDASDALIALGYDAKQARKAVLSVEGHDVKSSDQILKDALRYLY